MGEVQSVKDHLIHSSGNNFRVSAYLQELMCYTGTELVFEEASQMIKKTKGIEVTAKQIERVCHFYGQRLEEEQSNNIENGAPLQAIADNTEPHYAMLDGAMVLTREEKWKEIKLGRIFKATDNIAISKNRNEVTKSVYVPHLGSHVEFLKKFEYYLDEKKFLIFIADGAPWIWNWVDATYPESVQILDFYHAKEHLHRFAQLYFKEQQQREQWTDHQTLSLLNNRVDQVITNIQRLPKIRCKIMEQSRKALIKYYQTNSKRMQYKTYKEKGLMIGSGPIEAAHRNVIQQRLKLSGQRWTVNGVQQVANLRAVSKSLQWNKIVEHVSQAA